MNKTLIIKNDEQKIEITLSSDTERHSVDYKVRIYGDGNMDELPGAHPFKQSNFKSETDAATYFEEKVKYYEEQLNTKAHAPQIEQVINRIQDVKNKILGNSNNLFKP